MRIICERQPSHWSAWLESSPETAYDGDKPLTAVIQLVEATPGLALENISRDDETSTDDRREFVVGEVCPDCRGFGQFARLNRNGECGTCGGSGRIAH